MNMSHKMPFLALIFGLLEGQKYLHEANEFLSGPMQLYVFRMKEKGVVTEGKQDACVATKLPSVATEAQPGGSSSSAVQSFFRAELHAIKEKQVLMNQKVDKTTL